MDSRTILTFLLFCTVCEIFLVHVDAAISLLVQYAPHLFIDFFVGRHECLHLRSLGIILPGRSYACALTHMCTCISRTHSWGDIAEFLRMPVCHLLNDAKAL